MKDGDDKQLNKTESLDQTEERIVAEIESLRKKLGAVDLREAAISLGFIPTGVVAFDLMTGGGFPKGRFSEVFGEWQSGKSLLMYQTIAQCQHSGGVAVLLDSERALEPRWASLLGIDSDTLVYFTPKSLEEGFRTIEDLVLAVREKDSPLKDKDVLIVWDSLAASIAREEIGKDYGAPEMALRARTISGALRRLVSLIADERIALVFINQLRSKIGVMFGSTEDTTGGRAPKFYASLRIGISKGKKIKKDNKVIGVTGSFEVVKSKVGIPFKKAGFEIYFRDGIPHLSGLLNFLVDEGVIVKTSQRKYQFTTGSGEVIEFIRQQFGQIWSDHSEEMRQRLLYTDEGEEGGE